MDENALAVRGECSADVVVRVDDGISGIAVADLQIDDLAAAAVDQVVGIARAGFKPAHIPGRSGVSPALVTSVGSPSTM